MFLIVGQGSTFLLMPCLSTRVGLSWVDAAHVRCLRELWCRWVRFPGLVLCKQRLSKCDGGAPEGNRSSRNSGGRLICICHLVVGRAQMASTDAGRMWRCLWSGSLLDLRQLACHLGLFTQLQSPSNTSAGLVPGTLISRSWKSLVYLWHKCIYSDLVLLFSLLIL